ncbi:MAG: bifunctional metallophosphatase/5'-nucleotidase, partial [Candidatus Limnocylindria bacterium]
AVGRAATAPLAADRFQILHTNDIHGRLEATTIGSGGAAFQLGGLATLAGMVSTFRARAPERTLLLDAGDAWQGTFASNANRGQAVTKAMSLMRYDAMALGNHEFDWGQQVIADRAREAAFPFLAANLRDGRGGPPPWARPYIVKDLGVARVGVIGLTNPGTPAINKPQNVAGLAFQSSVDGVRRYLGEVRGLADIVVVLSHTGVDDDTALAQALSGVDLIVGGHTHLPLRTPRTVGAVRIYQAGAYTENLGRIEVTVDPATKKIRGLTGADALVAVATGAATPDPEIERLVAERRADAEKVTGRVVGRTTIPLEQQSAGEFPLGNLVADAMLEYARAQGWSSDLALHNNSGIRARLEAGEISYGRLYQVLPFDNAVVSIELTGAQLLRILERTVRSRAGNLVIAGGTYAFRMSQPAGSRIAAVTIGGRPLDPARVYRVATIDYLALGGDDQPTFREGRNIVYGDLTADVVAAYLGARSPVTPRVEGRITQR